MVEHDTDLRHTLRPSLTELPAAALAGVEVERSTRSLTSEPTVPVQLDGALGPEIDGTRVAGRQVPERRTRLPVQ